MNMEINETWQNAFQSELRNNLYKLSNGCQRQLYIKDITQECLWYSIDMCLHFYRTGEFYGIRTDTIDKITYNVCIAMSKDEYIRYAYNILLPHYA